jgi:hypothetical protein
MRRFSRIQVVIPKTPTSCRVLQFVLLEADLVLDYDADEERKTTRHKFVPVATWSRLDTRHNTLPQRPVPVEAINQALAEARGQIQYVEDWNFLPRAQ